MLVDERMYHLAKDLAVSVEVDALPEEIDDLAEALQSTFEDWNDSRSARKDEDDAPSI